MKTRHDIRAIEDAYEEGFERGFDACPKSFNRYRRNSRAWRAWRAGHKAGMRAGRQA